MKKLIALLLALCMVASLFAGCGGTEETTAPDASDATAAPDATGETGEDVDISSMSYDEASSYLYDMALGEFYDIYMEALEQEDQSMRFALMAIAEAKLLESGVMLPLSTNGGNFAIGRVAPYGYGNAKWGNDYKRFHDYIVVDSELPILASERAEMKEKWNELRGTGTYEDWVKEYLTGKGYTLKDTFTMGYSSDPQTWDVLATSRAADSEAIVNTYDGLYEYDCEGTLQPALAESYEVSEDGTVYTFTLREGLVWVDSQGREVAPVVADDFVAGMQHMMDAMGGLEYLVGSDGCAIVNADAYINAEVDDFAEVGVKAIDDRTVEYTLEAPCPFFMTFLGYGVFAPMSRSFYESMGGKFGADFNSEDEAYTYGKDPNSIAYCGPYVVTNATAENTIVFQANESYWNAENINIHTLTWLYNDGQDPLKGYNDAKAGVLDASGLNASSLEVCKADGLFDDYAYATETDATSFMAFNNINRSIYANFNDDTTVVSTLTPEEGDRTNTAMRNAHFRRALCMAVDRASYNAQTVGEELKLNSLRNTYTPGDFVFIDSEVTVDINGTATTFPAGTFYGEIMQAQIDADGIAIKVWDPDTLLSDGFDGWYNPEAAAAELEAAIAELAEQGIVIDESNPIYIDLPVFTGSETFFNRANVYKQSVESALGGKVIVNLTECVDADQWYYAGYYTDLGSDANYTVYDVSGWGPDYGDPATYLNTFLPDYAGYMVKCIGIF